MVHCSGTGAAAGLHRCAADAGSPLRQLEKRPERRSHLRRPRFDLTYRERGAADDPRPDCGNPEPTPPS